MFSKEIRSLFPPDFTYWKASWYKHLSEERDRFHFNVLVAAYIIAMAIPLALLLHGVISGHDELLINYVIALICMSCLTIYLLIRRNVRIMAPVSLAVCAVGFCGAVLLPGSQSVYFLMFFAFPQLAILLVGNRRGGLWGAGFLVCAVLLYVGKEAGMIPAWQVTFDNNQLIIGFFTFLLLFAIAFTTDGMYQKHLMRMIRGLVFDDETGLPGKNVLKLCMKSDRTYVLSIFRIFNFSELISIFGHNLSLPVLRFASEQLFGLTRDIDCSIFRLSGAEFALLVPVGKKTEHERILRELELIRDRLQAVPLYSGFNEIHLRYQIGTALIKPENQHLALKFADEALKRKQHLTFFDSRHHSFSNKSAEQYQALINNKKNNSFRAFYQPIVNNRSGKIEWLESLMRVHVGEERYDSIHSYMDIARSTGLYPDITRFMLDNAARMLPTMPYDLSINITMADILDPSFMTQARSVCRAIADCPNTLIFEIIESEELSDLQVLKNFIDMVHGHGCKVAIDDFGSGYSNFVNLADLDIDIVKIDGSLVKKSGGDKKVLAIIETIQRLCARSGFKTVAEYVENQSLLNTVKGLKIDYSQGYMFSRPVETASVFN
jgi:EAL domain-containing protein (putative c-di-GMP-specific phosphodiesterase class I)